MDIIENTENSDIENITKISQKKILMSKGGKEKTDKQIKQWENAQNMRLRKAQLKKERDDEIASIRNENNNLKKQMVDASKKVKTNKIAIIKEIIKPDSDTEFDASTVSDSDLSVVSSSTESESDSDSEEEEEITPKKAKTRKGDRRHIDTILEPKNSNKSHRMSNRKMMKSPEDKADYSHFFI